MYKYIVLMLFLFLSIPPTYAQVDTVVGLNVSGGSDYKEVAHQLCDGIQGDQLKVNAIYNWITHNIRYNIKAVQSGFLKPEKPEKVFKNRLGVCDGYAKLFTAMCLEVGIKAVSIEGYSKDWTFDNGDKLIIPRHMWCATYINGKWELSDPTWGAGYIVQSPTIIQKIINKITFRKVTYAKKLKFVFHYNPEYFTQKPEDFRLKHLPSDPLWQLSDSIMPLSVFEAGDSAVLAFNAITQPDQNSEKLYQISGLTEDSVAFDAAGRAYKFNERFPVALAIIEASLVESNLNQILTEADPEKGKKMWKEAEHALKNAEVHIKEQKKYFPTQYADLKKKNRTKNTAAKMQLMQVKTDDKKLLAQCTQKKRSVDNKLKRVRKKYAETAKRKQSVDPEKVKDIPSSKAQKKAESPEMMAATDSLIARKWRVDTLLASMTQNDSIVKWMMETNNKRLDTLLVYLKRSDSLLILEALNRIQMHDNYDDTVIKLSGWYRQEKYGMADSFHKLYFAYFDTILQNKDNWQKMKRSELDAYKANLRDLEKMAKWSNADPNIVKQYETMANEYLFAIDSANNEMAITANYIKSNKALFYSLSKMYKRQLRITDYMSKVEDIRKKLELNTLLSKQKLDLTENKRQIANVKNAINKMERVYK